MQSNGKLLPLEGLRGFVALYVFLHHAHIVPNQGLGRFLYFGQEAVIVFFILSGFVINYSISGSVISIPRYIRARARRIYPVFLVSLGLAYLSACVQAREAVPLELYELVGNMLMLQDASALKPGVVVDTYHGNSPLWSLSYEWWFYMAFIPIALTGWVEGRLRLPLVTTAALLGCLTYSVFPNQLSLIGGYLLLWWSGVELSREYLERGEVTPRGQAALLIVLSLASICWLIPVALQVLRGQSIQLGVHPFLEARHYLAAMLIVAVVVFSSTRVKTLVARFLMPFVWLAPVSFFLYVAHQPILNIVSALVPSAPPVIVATLSLPIVLLLGWLFEVRLQSAVNRALPLSTKPVPAVG